MIWKIEHATEHYLQRVDCTCSTYVRFIFRANFLFICDVNRQKQLGQQPGISDAKRRLPCSSRIESHATTIGKWTQFVRTWSIGSTADSSHKPVANRRKGKHLKRSLLWVLLLSCMCIILCIRKVLSGIKRCSLTLPLFLILLRSDLVSRLSFEKIRSLTKTIINHGESHLTCSSNVYLIVYL